MRIFIQASSCSDSNALFNVSQPNEQKLSWRGCIGASLVGLFSSITFRVLSYAINQSQLVRVYFVLERSVRQDLQSVAESQAIFSFE
jgi:hypothetical protein